MIKEIKKKRRSIRLKEFDYATEGAYFITVCTHKRRNIFGSFVGAGPRACPELELNDTGQMITDTWCQIPDHYPGIKVDAFVIMPNHLHGILSFGPANGQPQGVAPTKFSLSGVVGRFKSMTTTRYTASIKETGLRPYPGILWQRNYYEHVIRDEDELNLVREYIVYNPVQWKYDKYNIESIDDIEYSNKWAWLENK